MTWLVIGSFGVTSLGYPAPDSSAMNSNIEQSGLNISSLIEDPSRLAIPFNHVSLNEIHKGTNGKLIIHIQDAHSNLGGQKNLARALDHFMNRYDIPLVLVEGAAKDVSLDGLKARTPSEDWRRTAEKLIHEGIISGEEYLNLTTDHPMQLRGIEYRDLYDANLAAYARMKDRRKDILLYLHRVNLSISKLKGRIYPEFLLKYEDRYGSGNADKHGFQKRIRDLADLAVETGTDLSPYTEIHKLVLLQEREKRIDFGKANAEQSALFKHLSKQGHAESVRDYIEASKETQNLQASQYVLLSQILELAYEAGVSPESIRELRKYESYLHEFADLDILRLLEELEVLEDDVYRNLLGEDVNARSLRAVDRYTRLLAKAYRIKLSSREFEILQANRPDFVTESWQAVINRQLADLGFYESLIPYESYLDDAESELKVFYDMVDKRDIAFLQNAGRIMDEEKRPVAFLIAGGYHTEHLTRLMRREGTSYVVLTPVVKYETDHEKYEEILLAPYKEAKKRSLHREKPSKIARLGSVLQPAMSGVRKLALMAALVYLSQSNTGQHLVAPARAASAANAALRGENNPPSALALAAARVGETPATEVTGIRAKRTQLPDYFDDATYKLLRDFLSEAQAVGHVIELNQITGSFKNRAYLLATRPDLFKEIQAAFDDKAINPLIYNHIDALLQVISIFHVLIQSWTDPENHQAALDVVYKLTRAIESAQNHQRSIPQGLGVNFTPLRALADALAAAIIERAGRSQSYDSPAGIRAATHGPDDEPENYTRKLLLDYQNQARQIKGPMTPDRIPEALRSQLDALVARADLLEQILGAFGDGEIYAFNYNVLSALVYLLETYFRSNGLPDHKDKAVRQLSQRTLQRLRDAIVHVLDTQETLIRLAKEQGMPVVFPGDLEEDFRPLLHRVVELMPDVSSDPSTDGTRTPITKKELQAIVTRHLSDGAVINRERYAEINTAISNADRPQSILEVGSEVRSYLATSHQRLSPGQDRETVAGLPVRDLARAIEEEIDGRQGRLRSLVRTYFSDFVPINDSTRANLSKAIDAGRTVSLLLIAESLVRADLNNLLRTRSLPPSVRHVLMRDIAEIPSHPTPSPLFVDASALPEPGAPPVVPIVAPPVIVTPRPLPQADANSGAPSTTRDSGGSMPGQTPVLAFGTRVEDLKAKIAEILTGIDDVANASDPDGDSTNETIILVNWVLGDLQTRFREALDDLEGLGLPNESLFVEAGLEDYLQAARLRDAIRGINILEGYLKLKRDVRGGSPNEGYIEDNVLASKPLDALFEAVTDLHDQLHDSDLPMKIAGTRSIYQQRLDLYRGFLNTESDEGGSSLTDFQRVFGASREANQSYSQRFVAAIGGASEAIDTAGTGQQGEGSSGFESANDALQTLDQFFNEELANYLRKLVRHDESWDRKPFGGTFEGTTYNLYPNLELNTEPVAYSLKDAINVETDVPWKVRVEIILQVKEEIAEVKNAYKKSFLTPDNMKAIFGEEAGVHSFATYDGYLNRAYRLAQIGLTDSMIRIDIQELIGDLAAADPEGNLRGEIIRRYAAGDYEVSYEPGSVKRPVTIQEVLDRSGTYNLGNNVSTYEASQVLETLRSKIRALAEKYRSLIGDEENFFKIFGKRPDTLVLQSELLSTVSAIETLDDLAKFENWFTEKLLGELQGLVGEDENVRDRTLSVLRLPPGQDYQVERIDVRVGDLLDDASAPVHQLITVLKELRSELKISGARVQTPEDAQWALNEALVDLGLVFQENQAYAQKIRKTALVIALIANVGIAHILDRLPLLRRALEGLIEFSERLADLLKKGPNGPSEPPGGLSGSRKPVIGEREDPNQFSTTVASKPTGDRESSTKPPVRGRADVGTRTSTLARSSQTEPVSPFEEILKVILLADGLKIQLRRSPLKLHVDQIETIAAKTIASGLKTGRFALRVDENSFTSFVVTEDANGDYIIYDPALRDQGPAFRIERAAVASTRREARSAGSGLLDAFSANFERLRVEPEYEDALNTLRHGLNLLEELRRVPLTLNFTQAPATLVFSLGLFTQAGESFEDNMSILSVFKDAFDSNRERYGEVHLAFRGTADQVKDFDNLVSGLVQESFAVTDENRVAEIENVLTFLDFVRVNTNPVLDPSQDRSFGYIGDANDLEDDKVLMDLFAKGLLSYTPAKKALKGQLISLVTPLVNLVSQNAAAWEEDLRFVAVNTKAGSVNRFFKKVFGAGTTPDDINNMIVASRLPNIIKRYQWLQLKTIKQLMDTLRGWMLKARNILTAA